MRNEYDGDLRMVICPLGDDCLGDGPTCFVVSAILTVGTLPNVKIRGGSPPRGT